MSTSISTHLDGRAVPDRYNAGDHCICHSGGRHGVTIALNELADDGSTRHGVHLTVWVDTPSLYVVARELERIADHCRGAHQRMATGEELSEALEGAVDDLLAAVEVAPHEDTGAAGAPRLDWKPKRCSVLGLQGEEAQVGDITLSSVICDDGHTHTWAVANIMQVNMIAKGYAQSLLDAQLAAEAALDDYRARGTAAAGHLAEGVA